MIQNTIVAFIVVIAAVYILRRSLKSVKGGGCGCTGGCGEGENCCETPNLMDDA